MKPLTSCAFFGANRVLAGIRDALIIQHSVIGCHWGTLALSYNSCPNNVRQASTVVYNENVIEGGNELLEKALREAEELYGHMEAVFIISGCVPNMIGDNVDGVIKAFPSKRPLAHVAAPGYSGHMEEGMLKAYKSLLPFIGKGSRSSLPTVNIMGLMADDPYVKEDMAALKRLLAGKVAIGCCLHSCTMEELGQMASADLNISFGTGVALAQELEKAQGMAYWQAEYPYGIGGLKSFLRELGKRLEVDFTEEIAALEEAGKGLASSCADYLVNLYQLPVALLGDRAHLQGMKSFLTKELGMVVVIEELIENADLNKIAQAIEEKGPVLLCGSSFMRELAKKKSIPLLPYIYPLFHRINLTSVGLVGAEGTAHLLEQLINSALEQEYKEEGLYAGLREAINE